MEFGWLFMTRFGLSKGGLDMLVMSPTMGASWRSVGDGKGTSDTRTVPVSRGVSPPPPLRCLVLESVISLRGDKPLLRVELVEEVLWDSV